jgi:hypothetical protein
VLSEIPVEFLVVVGITGNGINKVLIDLGKGF